MLASGTVEPSELAEAFGDIAGDGVRADQIIKRLRELLRKGEIERTPVHVSDLVRAIEPLARADANQHGVELRIDLAPDLPATTGDGIQLQQVVLNLVRNAVDAMRHLNDGGRLVVRAAGSALGTIEVTVSDTGPALDDAQFADVRALLHDQAGRVGDRPLAQSLDRRGARRAPVGDAQSGAWPHDALHAALRDGRVSETPRVFVVDDDTSVRTAVSRLLRTEGFVVDTFESAQHFLAQGVPEGPCCLVLDVRMPAVGGLELQDRLSHAGLDVGIVFLTGTATSRRAFRP